MKLYEFEPMGGSPSPRATRREDAAVLTCERCGCRLIARESLADGGGIGPDAAWRHFPGMPGVDARGCRIECIDAVHRTLPLEVA